MDFTRTMSDDSNKKDHRVEQEDCVLDKFLFLDKDDKTMNVTLYKTVVPRSSRQ